MNTGNVLLSSEDQELVTYMAEHPDPMWVYDVQTCRFLEVNPAAVRHYGYSRDEFLQMSLFDIRPEEDWPGLAEDLRKPRPRFQFSGGWRHRLKNGEIHEVEIRSQLLRFQGRPAAWVEVRDLTVERRNQRRKEILERMLRFTTAINQALVETRNAEAWLEQAIKGVREAGGFAWAVAAMTRPGGEPAGKVYAAGLGLRESHRKHLEEGPWPACFQRALVSPEVHVTKAGELCETCSLRDICPRFDTWHVRLEWRQAVRGVLMVALPTGQVELDAEVQAIFLELASDLARGMVLLEQEAERELLADALEESEARFRGIFDNAAVALYRSTPEGRIVLANPALLRLLGYERPEELAAVDLNEQGYAPGYSRRAFLECIERDGRVYAFETAWRRRDGSPVHVLESAVAVRDAEGRTLYYDGSAVDITPLKKAEARAEWLASFPELNPNPVLAFDRSARLTYANPAASRLAQSLGVPGIENLFPADLPQIVAECLAENKPRLRLETRHGRRILSWSFYPIASHELVHCYVGEVTQQIELEDQLRQAQKLEALGRLAGGVAHDFNNILTVIMMNVALLQEEDGLPAEVQEAVHQIAQAAERASNLTRQLLAFSRRQKPQLRFLDLNDVVSGLGKMLQRIIGEDITLQLRLQPGGAPLRADPGMLEQVLMNLAVNARDAMPKGGLLEIVVQTVALGTSDLTGNPDRREGEFVRLTVRDTGCGIPAHLLPKIFEPFFTTKEVGKGTGLGLATVHGIVQQHEGWIEVESQEGMGTAFLIYLPRAHATANPNAGAVSSAPVPGGHETILLVEDEDKVRAMARTVLQARGYTVLEATDARAALVLWESLGNKVDLVLSDMIMPGGLTGAELVERLRRERPGLKALLMSGYPGEVATYEKHLRPGDRILPKPFGPMTLARAVRDCLDGRAADPTH
ncbi:PAS domain S-box protein [Limisphaera sp. VF-2]|uniref:PAS domain S-box protein n=1 Tax=Limisphaera sp. VF-2 TaxID=3400418 RepID=UPI0017621CB5